MRKGYYKKIQEDKMIDISNNGLKEVNNFCETNNFIISKFKIIGYGSSNNIWIFEKENDIK